MKGREAICDDNILKSPFTPDFRRLEIRRFRFDLWQYCSLSVMRPGVGPLLSLEKIMIVSRHNS
jgi:hypothetical protein